MKYSILIIEDEKNTREGLWEAFHETYNIYLASNVNEAIILIDKYEFDVILTDLQMPDKSGFAILEKFMILKNRPICIMITAYGNVEIAVQAMKYGAFDFLTKPIELDKLETLIKKGLTLKEERERNISSDDKIIGKSKNFLQVIKEIKRVAQSTASVLLYGETGTGKELFAKLIHSNSSRSLKPFMPIHCASLSSTLLESELFGHEKGSFTGAFQRHKGKFESANGGTVFLDEIGEINNSIQVKLLRFLETRMIQRIGSNESIAIDIRLVCATNKNLEEMIKNNNFREDLYYRLNVVKINLPPLRIRKSDISILIKYYINFFSKKNNIEPININQKALEVLIEYSWPGNVRELKNFCENIVVMCEKNEIHTTDLPNHYFKKKNIENNDFKEEKDLLKQALISCNGNKTKAAIFLGISRRTLHRKLVQWPEIKLINKKI